jgi:hypothetical protein
VWIIGEYDVRTLEDLVERRVGEIRARDAHPLHARRIRLARSAIPQAAIAPTYT